MAAPATRVPAGDPRRGRIHPGEFAGGDAKPAPATRGRRSGAPVPATAPLHNPKHEKGLSSAHERDAIRREHESRLPEEMGGNFECKHCGWAGWREHPVMTREGKWHGTLAMAGCTRCGTLHPTHVGVAGEHSPQHHDSVRGASDRTTDPRDLRARPRKRVQKTVDTSETALAADGVQGVTYVGHRVSCPAGGDSPCGAELDGRCGLCNARVQDHQALGKTASVLLELRELAGLT